MKERIYLGVSGCRPREVFRYKGTPTQESHGDRYAAVIGPFRTMRAARFMAECGQGNPHLQTVADAERLAPRN